MSQGLKPHCDSGAYVGGSWVPIEECGSKFLCQDIETSGSKLGCTKNCAACPRSRSRNTAAKADGSYDVVVIGAGGIGSMIARELSKTTAKVLLLEAADDVTQGATKGNSGIIHAGFDDKPGSLRAKFCPTGCRMYPKLDEELHFGYQKNSSLVIAKSPQDEAHLEKLLEQGRVNGVQNLRIIGQEELRKREPFIHPDATKALLAEDAGTIIPYEFCIAVAENAVDNGVELRIRRQVTAIEQLKEGAKVKGFKVTAKHWEPAEYVNNAGGSGKFGLIVAAVGILLGVVLLVLLPSPFPGMAAMMCGLLAGTMLSKGSSSAIAAAFNGAQPSDSVTYEPSHGTKQGGIAAVETVYCDYIVNAAGCQSDAVAAMLGDTSFKVNERYGEYVLLHKREGKKASSTIFPCPGPMGKGVLVQNTVWGNLILGPTARDKLRVDNSTGELVVNEKTRDESKDDVIKSIMAKCRALVPDFNAKEVIHTFMGARAKTTRGDWVIEPCPTAPHMIHAAGIDSPGLAAAPAIALEVVRLLKEQGAPVTGKNPKFNPIRAPIVMPKKGMKDATGKAIKMGPEGSIPDPQSYVVCKCEKVTEQEVVEALRRSLPIDSTQAIRKRTRAGMGHCQGDPNNYCCEDRVAKIIARETGLNINQVGRRPWPASSLMPRRFFNDKDREWVESLSHDD